MSDHPSTVRCMRVDTSGGFHTLVLPLAVSPSDARSLEVRFEAGFHCYRGTVREALRRLSLLRQSRAWRTARTMPTRTPAEVKARNAAGAAARRVHELTEADLASYARQARNASGWMTDHLDSAVAEGLGRRVWESVAKHLFNGGSRSSPPRPGRSSPPGRCGPDRCRAPHRGRPGR